MSQSSMLTFHGRFADSSTERIHTVVNEQSIQKLLFVLDDADCRAILNATSDTALSASEVSETCELPLSTAYRKLDLLSSADLLDERTRIRRSGKHASEYSRSVSNIVISITPRGEIELEVSHRETAD